ncbi:MAG: cupredoxin domain-containing protein [Chloroflexota bacterium]|nr:cupredoxin domain-containing protein [Chloroflexota bacterium]MDQ5867184.1 cupredoxin domain-containing protein [Chloroflexota bacterium]
MNNTIWIIYAIVVLGVALVVGRYLGRFREAYTEMTGMMVGMTMGMLNGFLVGYAAAAFTSSMFWGNLIGLPLGLLLGVWYGRAGGLMGVMDGGMGGAMGGSMGAMLAAMLAYPTWALNWTAVLLVAVYMPGMLGLVLLIERSAPGHAALHRLLPFFARAVNAEVREELESPAGTRSTLHITDYYAFLGVAPEAHADTIAQAYLEKLATSTPSEVRTAEVAFATLTDPTRRRAYDAVLAAHRPIDASGDYSTPSHKNRTATRPRNDTIAATAAATGSAAAIQVRPRKSKQPQQAQQAPASHQERSRAVARKKEAPISWVGVTAGLVTLAVLGLWWLAAQSGRPAGMGNQTATNLGTPVLGYVNNERNLPESEVRKLEAKAVTVPVASDGKQKVNFTVVGDTMSYKPRVLKVKKDVPVHFTISVEGRDPGCGQFVAFRGLGAHGLAQPGKINTAEFTASTTGVYEINCGMEMMEPGYILVTE